MEALLSQSSAFQVMMKLFRCGCPVQRLALRRREDEPKVYPTVAGQVSLSVLPCLVFAQTCDDRRGHGERPGGMTPKTPARSIDLRRHPLRSSMQAHSSQGRTEASGRRLASTAGGHESRRASHRAHTPRADTAPQLSRKRARSRGGPESGRVSARADSRSPEPRFRGNASPFLVRSSPDRSHELPSLVHQATPPIAGGRLDSHPLLRRFAVTGIEWFTQS